MVVTFTMSTSVDDAAERIANLAIKIQTILDERMKVITEKSRQPPTQPALAAKPKVSLDALDAIPKTAQRDKIEETKTAIIGAVDTVATATGVAASLETNSAASSKPPTSTGAANSPTR